MLRRVMSAGVTGWPDGGSDADWASVVALLNFQGAHGSTTFIDATGKTWTAESAAKIENGGGESYGVFDGIDDRISTPDSADFNFGAGDFCIEAIITPSADSDQVRHIGGQHGSAPGMCCHLYTYGTATGMAAGTAATGGYDAGFDLSGGTGATAGTRVHVALTRSGNVFRAFLDGVQVATKTDSRTLFNSTKNFFVGGNDHASKQEFTGKIHALRVTKGVARYTGTFTPPTWPLPTHA
jgi:hypothetical protein